MFMARLRIAVLITLVYPVLAPAQNPAMVTRVAGTEQGVILFQERCMACHGREEFPLAPAPEVLRSMPAQRIYDVLTTGAMQVHTRDLSDADIRMVSESVSGELLGSEAAGDAAAMPNQCDTGTGFNIEGPAWNGWGAGHHNSRHQDALNAGIRARQVPDLKLLWAFGFPGGISAYGQPTVTGGRVFVGSDNGYVYSLDAGSGCVYWSFRAQSGVRTSISIGPVEAGEVTAYAAFFGDMKANLYAIDADSGELMWHTRTDDHIAARATASPVLHEGILYVPVSAWEEGAARSEYYPCCTFRGSVAAYNAGNGKQLWKTYAIEQAPGPVRKNAIGTQLFAPAGAAVWNTPVIDPQAGALYFGTGNGYTWPAADHTDSVMALDMHSGEMLWNRQLFSGDAFLVGCGAVDSENCPEELGQDRDIPSALILTENKTGKRSLIVSARPNEILSLDPDHKGALRWRVQVPHDHPGGGLIWGGTSDGRYAYFGLSSGGMVAVDLADGTERWFSSFGGDSNGAVASSIDGVVFIGGLDGVIRALSSNSGKVIWRFETGREFSTVNGVRAKGGSITAAGTVIAGGRVFATSGYSVIFGTPGNVLLAFGTTK